MSRWAQHLDRRPGRRTRAAAEAGALRRGPGPAVRAARGKSGARPPSRESSVTRVRLKGAGPGGFPHSPGVWSVQSCRSPRLSLPPSLLSLPSASLPPRVSGLRFSEGSRGNQRLLSRVSLSDTGRAFPLHSAVPVTLPHPPSPLVHWGSG